MERLIQLGCLSVYVTFVDELASSVTPPSAW
jgi:hypothetical protein